MAPVKFDDLPKIAEEVLGDEGQVNSHSLKAKQKTHWKTSVGRVELVTQQLDFFGKERGTMPAKFVWKPLAPAGFGHYGVSKLEIDRGGKLKVEASSGSHSTGLKVDCKSTWSKACKLSVDHTFTGFKDTFLKLDLKLAKSPNLTGEATYSAGIATFGMKFNSAVLLGSAPPDLGARLFLGPFCCSLLAKERLGAFSAHGFYAATPDIRCAATYQHGGKAAGSFALAVSYQGLYKVRVAQDRSIYFSAKHSLAKGCTVLGGLRFDCCKRECFYGVQVFIE